MHDAVMCKDYFQDMFWSEHNDKHCEVYGLHWKPGKLSLLKEFYLMAVRYDREDMGAKAASMQAFLNTFEEPISFPPTEVQRSASPHIVVAKFSAAWTQTSVLLSAFTSLLRMSPAWDGTKPGEWFLKIEEGFKPFAPQPGKYPTMEDMAERKKKQEKLIPNAPYAWPDFQRMQVIRPRLGDLLGGTLPKQSKPWREIPIVGYAHCWGVMGGAW